MESLYRKYRPLTFESVVGQQHIVSTLEHAVAEGRLSHAYLFCGPRGTGKTTMARILAKSLLCEKAEAARAAGATGCNPDGTCPECEAIAAGTHPDVYELDAASRTGVDNVREEIINSVSFAPVRGTYKVYIIDEVHMLTTAAFNALLKTLEEPPAHVVFVLCTTDPQKLLETILSRCQRFDFHRIANEDLVARMRYICGEEGFAFDEEALEIVAKHARGGMRDALSTLEQLSVFGDGAVRVADARALLGEVASTVLAEFSCKIAVRDTPGLFGLVRAQVEEGNDLLELTRDLVGHMRDVYTAAIAGPRPELFDGTPEEVSAYVEEAKLFEGADRLARTLMVLDDAALEMRNASDARLVLEIALTRLARPEADLTLEALAERIARLEVQLAAGVPSGPARAEELVGAGAGAAAGARQAAAGLGAGAGTAPAATAGRTAAAAGAAAAPRKAGALPWETPAAASAAAAGVAGAAGPAAHAPAAPAAAQAPAASAAGSAAPGVPASKPAVAPASAHAPAAPAASAPTASAAQAAAPAPQPTAPAADRRAEVRAVEASAVAAGEGAAAEAAAQAASGVVDRVPVAPAASAPAASASAASAPVAPASAPATSASAAPARPTCAQQDEGVAAVMEPAAACAVTPAVDDAGELQRKWTDVVKRVVAAQPSRGALLQSSRAQRDDGETLVVGFPKGSNFAIKMIGRPDSQAVVQPIVCEVFGKRVVSYVMDGGPQPPASPAEAPAAAAGSGEPGASGSGAAAAAPAAAAGPVPAAVSSPAGAAPTAAASVAAASSVASSAGAPVEASAAAPAAGVSAPATAGPASATSAADRDSAASAAASGPASEAAGTAVAPAAANRVGASTPAAPGPAVDQTSGPTVLPERDVEADRRAWEDQVPYDDAMIAAYAGDDEELPPFDTGAAPSSAAPAAASSSPAPSSPAAPEASPVPAPAAPAPSASRAAAKPWERAVNPANAPVAAAAPASAPAAVTSAPAASAPAAPAPAGSAPAAVPGSGSSASPAADPAHPFSHEAEGTDAPQTVEEAKAMLGNIFGAGVVFKDVEE